MAMLGFVSHLGHIDLLGYNYFYIFEHKGDVNLLVAIWLGLWLVVPKDLHLDLLGVVPSRKNGYFKTISNSFVYL